MSQTQTLTNKATFGDRLIRSVQGYRRLHRLFFPSPAEVQFVRLMRGRALTLPFVRSRRDDYPLTFVWLGRLLKRELMYREVRVGKFFVDFGTPGSRFLKAIEIDGREYHHDIVAEQQRDDYLKARGWSVMHISGSKLQREPRKVYVDVLRFLRS